jgi:GR25 family glycosyltransferase involved in LPS biosynthesis
MAEWKTVYYLIKIRITKKIYQQRSLKVNLPLSTIFLLNPIMLSDNYYLTHCICCLTPFQRVTQSFHYTTSSYPIFGSSG